MSIMKAAHKQAKALVNARPCMKYKFALQCALVVEHMHNAKPKAPRVAKQITVTALKHPTMISKIREGLYHAMRGNGHLMNGHGKRVYIQNAQGRNIMRINWIGGKQGFIVWGNESADITDIIQKALK